MSEFTNRKDKRITKLLELAHLMLATGSGRNFIIKNTDFIEQVVPDDFITLFDELIKEGHAVATLKPLSNKLLNVFHTVIEKYEKIEPTSDSFLGVLESNNAKMVEVLNKIRPVFKVFVKDVNEPSVQEELKLLFQDLQVFVKHYTIKENVLFPVIEKTWPDYRCLQIMWSFHDDIRNNIKAIIVQLADKRIDKNTFNRMVGDVFFNMLAIKFREECILFPYILGTIPAKELDEMNINGFEIGYPYIVPPKPNADTSTKVIAEDKVNLGTGILSIDQIKLIFNHLPVDITYVDENDRVQYFSTPKKRIFPRTTAIIGREVSNCHPPESVHVVENIVASFRNGEKNQADFWIKMRGEYILIQYFAVRDENGIYRGVIEVSQEISEIKALEGEKRLLDW